ncbi:hypothetical protein MNV_680001 [Candidatus Methanoperedens nitroreducens]|uniref:Uncharacterized protein n=1 Tax=Candidatus Methanoperedens nitratireducens TaxID=1392998 RepID=A0A284VSR5_9EURY|nr:hypothetical protein MNV_680001 [Candidatus Methanoperedens nitroreducens]
MIFHLITLGLQPNFLNGARTIYNFSFIYYNLVKNFNAVKNFNGIKNYNGIEIFNGIVIFETFET